MGKSENCNLLPKGWNSWNPETMTSYVFAPEGIEIKVAFLLNEGKILDRLTWKDYVKVVGPHSFNGRYSQVTLDISGNKFLIEFSSINRNSLAGMVKPLDVHEDISVILILHNLRDPVRGTIKTIDDKKCLLKEKSNVFLTLSESSRWGAFPSITAAYSYLQSYKVLPNKIYDPPHVALFQLPSEKELFFAAVCSESIHPEVTEHCKNLLKNSGIILKEAAKSYEKEMPKVSNAGWKGVEEGIKRALAWNIIWDKKNNRVLCPVSRNWACIWGGWVLFDWDTFFTAILASLFDKELAYKIAASILEETTEEGFIPNYSCPNGKSTDRSQPPVGAYCILKLHKIHPNKEFLRRAYPKLKRWHLWWKKNRDGNEDGLLEWGTREGPVIRSGSFTDSSAGTAQAARFESGLDNSPMYDEISLMDCKNGCKVMNLTDVGLNALYALDAWSLSVIARELGVDDDVAFEKEWDELKRKINDVLWCEELGIYLNRYWDGGFSKVLSPTLFYPLLAGVVPPDKAKEMVKNHLLNEKEFWGKYAIPSVSFNHPAFKDQNYWRGRIWAPMNYLVAEGLRRYGFYDISYLLAEKSIRLFLREWREETHVHENYNAISGDGDDVSNSEPVYTWGALLGYLAIQELIDVEAWGDLRFGSPYIKEEVSIKGYNIGGNIYDIYASKHGLKVIRNGECILKSNTPILIRNYRRSENTIEFNVIGKDDKIAVLEIGDLENHSLKIMIGEKTMETKASQGKISIKVPLSPQGLNVKISKSK